MFPNSLEKVVVVPIYKWGSKDSVEQYRPISLLPDISKVLEKIINNRLVNFLETRNLISAAQFGFRADKSTSDTVHKLTYFVVNKLDAGNKCLTINIDLAKAFDTVSHPILLYKLKKMGIRGTQLQN